MTWRYVRQSLDQAAQMPTGPVREALVSAAEEAAQEAAAEAVEFARRVKAADAGLLGDALAWLDLASGPASEARLKAWDFWYLRMSAA